MSGVLDARFDRRSHRLALGVEPTDAARRTRVPAALTVAFDGAPTVPRERLPRRGSCRHVLVWRATLPERVTLRVLDDTRRYVPRRLDVELPTATVGRVTRPALFPGAAYDVAAGAVGMRGTVVLEDDAVPEGIPVRWTRVEARRLSDNRVVGRAHGDDRGEFLLLLDGDAAPATELVLPIRARVTVFGPDPPSVASPVPADPYDDLPVEPADLPGAPTADDLLRPGADPVLDGTALPDGYEELASRVVEFGLDGLLSERFLISPAP